MLCSRCGFKNDDSAFFCVSCGNKIGAPEGKNVQVTGVIATDCNVSNVAKDQPIIENTNKYDASQMNFNVGNNINYSVNSNQMNIGTNNFFGIQTGGNVGNQGNINNTVNTNLQQNNNMFGSNNQVGVNNYNKVYGHNNQNSNKNKSLYIIIILMGLVLIGLLTGVLFVINRSSNTRTIMIYMAGCNLESEGGLASNDLEAILPKEIDLEKTNILVYTGGTKKWYNEFDENENAIYLLKSTGFEKVESYDLVSLGDSATFETFLDYAYDNYYADVFDLIFWDHGLGVLGSISDEYTDDFLSIVEMESALKNSAFSKEKIIETVTFRTCLNGTIEVADTFAPYAKYMIASEEITIGSSNSNVLSFLNDVENNDDGIEYGKKFIESYQRQVEEIDFFGTTDSTYSIIELDKVDELIVSLGNFVSKINVSENYAQIARVRSNLHQYAEGSGCTDYDTVDLYQFVSNLNDLAPTEAKQVLRYLKDVVEYNWSTNDFSNGLSIYFPFNGSSGAQALHMELYEQIDFSEDYYNFINTFYNTKNNSTITPFNLQSRDVVNVGDKEFSLQLTEEEMANFASAQYTIFKKQDDGTFMPIVSSKNYKLSDSGILTTNVSNNLLKVIDPDTGEDAYVQAIEVASSGSNRQYNVFAVLYSFEGDISEWEVDSVNFHVTIDNNKVSRISKVTKLETDGLGVRVLDLNKYDTVQFTNFRYGILDANGNYNENWVSQNVKYLIELDVEGIADQLFVGSLDDADDYYCIFKIIDIKNNYHYSKLIKIN